MRFSASRLKLWMSCPLAAHYRYDEQLPDQPNGKTVFGTVIHQALELYNRTGDLDAAIKLFKVEWELAPERIRWWPRQTSWPALKKKGPEILRAVHESYRFQDRVVLASEIPFLVPFGDHELTGIIDNLETQRSGTGAEILKVVDYKTGSRNPSGTELALDVQMTVYTWAVSQRELWTGVPKNAEIPGVENGEWLWETIGRDMPKRAIWFNVWAGKQLDAGPRTDTDFGRLYRLCEEVARAVEQEVHVPKIGLDCEYCDYVEPCSLEIPVSLRARDDTDDDERWI